MYQALGLPKKICGFREKEREKKRIEKEIMRSSVKGENSSAGNPKGTKKTDRGGKGDPGQKKQPTVGQGIEGWGPG